LKFEYIICPLSKHQRHKQSICQNDKKSWCVAFYLALVKFSESASLGIPSLKTSWWLSYSYKRFLPLLGRQNVHIYCQKCCIFRTCKYPRHLVSQTKFCGTMGQNSTVPGKPGWMRSLHMLLRFIIFIY